MGDLGTCYFHILNENTEFANTHLDKSTTFLLSTSHSIIIIIIFLFPNSSSIEDPEAIPKSFKVALLVQTPLITLKMLWNKSFPLNMYKSYWFPLRVETWHRFQKTKIEAYAAFLEVVATCSWKTNKLSFCFSHKL